jgi:hypothetical protein
VSPLDHFQIRVRQSPILLHRQELPQCILPPDASVVLVFAVSESRLRSFEHSEDRVSDKVRDVEIVED